MRIGGGKLKCEKPESQKQRSKKNLKWKTRSERGEKDERRRREEGGEKEKIEGRTGKRKRKPVGENRELRIGGRKLISESQHNLLIL